MVAATACGVAAAYVPAVMGVMARVSFGVSRVMTFCGGISAVNRNEQKSTRQTKRGEQHHQFHRRLLRPHSNRFATARFLSLHVDHFGHRQPTRLLKIAHALLGSRAEISIDRDGKTAQREEFLDPLDRHFPGAALDRSIEIDFIFHSLLERTRHRAMLLATFSAYLVRTIPRIEQRLARTYELGARTVGLRRFDGFHCLN
jgi:hypothetical protein